MHCPKSNTNFRDITRNVEENTGYYTIYSAQYLVFLATFRVISQKIDYFWDSVLQDHCVKL